MHTSRVFRSAVADPRTVVTAGEDGAEDDRANLPASVSVRVWRPELMTLSIMLLEPPVSSGRRVIP